MPLGREALNENGDVVKRLGAFSGDAVHARVGDLSQFGGRAVQLRFHLRKASLYSFGFETI